MAASLKLRRRDLILGAALLALGAAPAVAQRDTTAVAGAHYTRGWLHRFFLGSNYRPLWTAPVPVRVMDLASDHGGLVPLSAGGGQQTLSLWFTAGDGYIYGFRSVDKAPSMVPEGLDSTFVEDLIRDQTSSQHPGAPAVVAPLLDAAGILHTNPVLAWIPDDPVLDTFATRFANAFGFLERRAIVQAGVLPFAGAREIISTRRLLPRLQQGPDDRVDARAYLTARLVDILIGDWDRHRGQWTWALFEDAAPRRWVPIPEDRDQAFVRFDGLLLGIVRQSVAPQLVNFGPRFANTVGQTWNGRDIDREFLTPLDGAVWDSIALDLQRRITDAVIDGAVAQMPEAWRALDGDRLAAALKARRDALPAEARRFYAILSREAEWHATDAAEDVRLVRGRDGSLAVTVARHREAPYASRTFLPNETEELRLYLYHGADRVVIEGDGPRHIGIRLVGGGDADVVDSSAAGGVTLYAIGNDRASGVREVPVEREAFQPPGRISGRPQRDWGRWTVPATWVGGGPDLGVFAGAGITTTRYGFRHYPYASRWSVRGGWATAANTGRVAVSSTFYREASQAHLDLTALASGIEVLYWHGRGNETQRTMPDAYYRVTQQELSLRSALVLPAGRMELRLGADVRYSHTAERAGRIIADSLPYGADDFAWIEMRGELAFDSRALRPDSLNRRDGPGGQKLTLRGSFAPGVMDARRSWGRLRAEATSLHTARRAPLRPTLALRAGGEKVFGTYPFHAAAFIGDASTVRLGRRNRYGGDAAAWGNAELRLRLGRHDLVIPGDIGLTGLADAGRVWVKGESSDTWHTAFGGGLWLSFAQPTTILSAVLAASRERTALYVSAGFSW